LQVALEMGDVLYKNLLEYYTWPDDNGDAYYYNNAMTTPIVYSWNNAMLKVTLSTVYSSPSRRPWEHMPWRSVRSSGSQLFPLNDFFSRNTRPISTKLGRKHNWGMGI